MIKPLEVKLLVGCLFCVCFFVHITLVIFTIFGTVVYTIIIYLCL